MNPHTLPATSGAPQCPSSSSTSCPRPSSWTPRAKRSPVPSPASGTAFQNVRIGKRIELTVEGEVTEEVLAEAKQVAEDVLSNQVIEDVVGIEVVE